MIGASRSYYHGMRSVGLKVLKNKLAEYVRLAQSGETILITDRERVVAELSPPASGRGARLSDAVLANAVRDGLLVAPVLPPGPPPASVPVAPLDEILAELDTDRADR
jgi:antitoxin (DNA-binding transcriptional repressor) of toxin-antitoxin stability system